MDTQLNSALWTLAEGGLGNLTREKLATALEKPLSEVEVQFPKDSDLLLRLIYDLQAEVGIPEFGDEDRPQDRLFEIVMAYLDAMTPHKIAIHRVWQDVWVSPLTICALRPHHLKITESILRESGLVNDDFCAPVRLRAYGAFFLYTLHAWLKDDTPDQAKTMATVDSGLSQISEWDGYFARMCG